MTQRLAVLKDLCQRAANFVGQGFDSREALALRRDLKAAGFHEPTFEERRVMLGQDDLDGADWS